MAARSHMLQEMEKFRADAKVFGSQLLVRDDLIPELRAHYDKQARQLGYVPIIILDRASAIPPGKMDAVKQEGGFEVFYIDEGSRRWTRTDVLQKLQTDASMKMMPRVTDTQVRQDFAALAMRAGIKPVPEIYLASSNHYDAAAGMTEEGKPYVLVRLDAGRDALRGRMAHELGHIALGHMTIDNQVAAHNDLKLARRQEYDADRFAKDICEGAGLIAAFRIDQQRYRQLAQERGMTAEALEARDTTHPRPGARIAKLETSMKHDAGKCTVPEGPPKLPDVRTVAGKELPR